jgi:hypothetical protein
MNMQQNRTVSRSPYETTNDWMRARNILAKSFYKELKANGLNHRQIVELSNELLQMVSEDFQKGESVW